MAKNFKIEKNFKLKKMEKKIFFKKWKLKKFCGAALST